MPRRQGIKTYCKRRSSHISLSSIATLNETASSHSASSSATSTQNKIQCTDADIDISQILANHNHSSHCDFNTSPAPKNVTDDGVGISSGIQHDNNDCHGMSTVDSNCNGGISSSISIPSMNMRESDGLSNNSNKVTVDMTSHQNYSDVDD